MLDLTLTILVVGLAAAGLAALIRAAPWPLRLKERKPLGCIACMSAWSALAVLVLATLADYLEWRGVPGYIGAVVVWLAATGISVYVVSQAGVFADWTPLGASHDEVDLSDLTQREGKVR